VTSRRVATRYLLILAASSSLASCAVTDTTRYYTLGQPAGAGAGLTASASSSRSAAGAGTEGIGVGPVIMPGYLDRIQIVTRTSSDRVQISTFYRWAEPLDEGIVRILGEEIGADIPNERVITYPWQGVVVRTIQYQVVVVMLRFDGRLGGDVTLDARWRILGRDGAELAFKRSTIVEDTAGSGYEPMVAAMTRALLTLGQEIASEIRAMPR
jgi:uncharacterized lipoprotein YmbA